MRLRSVWPLVSRLPRSRAPKWGAVEIRQGVIEQITTGTISDSHHAGLGAVVGGLAGLGIGSLIGAGTGRDVAMVAGAPRTA